MKDDEATQPEDKTLPQMHFMEQQRSVFDVPELTPMQKLLDEMYARAQPIVIWHGISPEANQQNSNDAAETADKRLNTAKD